MGSGFYSEGDGKAREEQSRAGTPPGFQFLIESLSEISYNFIYMRHTFILFWFLKFKKRVEMDAVNYKKWNEKKKKSTSVSVPVMHCCVTNQPKASWFKREMVCYFHDSVGWVGSAGWFFCFFGHPLRSPFQLTWAGRLKALLSYLERSCSSSRPLLKASSGFLTARWSQGLGDFTTSTKAGVRRKAEATRSLDPEQAQPHFCCISLVKTSPKPTHIQE